MQANLSMLERWKGYLIKAIAEMKATAPVADPELDELEDAIKQLPLSLENWNDEDRPYQQYFQQHVSWKVDLLSKFNGISGKFAKAAWTVYRYSLSMVREIDADDDLLEIGKLLESVAETALDSVSGQNGENFYLAYYKQRLIK